MSARLHHLSRDAALAAPPLQPAEHTTAMLRSLDVVGREHHILVIGRDGLELMCSLLRSGAAQVTHLCSHERPEANSASLAIVPNVPSVDWLASALPSIRRALHANGHLTLAVAMRPAMQQTVRRVLMLNGFTAIQVQVSAGRCIFHSKVEASAMRRCA